jgi:hypothetical protein
MRRLVAASLLLALIAATPAGDGALYSNDFTKASPGKLPDGDEFLALAGEFAVKDVDGNRVLEVAPTPLEAFGLLFGPTPEKPTYAVGARVWAASTGRRVPEFGIGSNDAGGYKLWLMPRQKRVAIRRGDETLATAPYDAWQTQTWTTFRLEVVPAGEGKWTVRGKVWAEKSEEPKSWTITFDDTAEPPAGRASVWANPYSGQPVRFDDLVVRPLSN